MRKLRTCLSVFVLVLFLGLPTLNNVCYGALSLLDEDSDLDLTGVFDYVVGVGDRNAYCPLSVSDGSGTQIFEGDIDADGPYPPGPGAFIEGYTINYQHAWPTGRPSGAGLSDNLKDVLSSWGYKDANGGSNELEIDMDVTSGRTYKVQLAWQYNWTDGRNYIFDVYVEGIKVLDDLCPEVDIVGMGSTLDVDAVMYTYEFTAGDSNLDINLTYAGHSNKNNDWIPILNLLTLEDVNAVIAPVAHTPDPNNGDTSVSIDKDLSWAVDGDPNSYDVYFGTDETAVTNAVHLLADFDNTGQVDLGDIVELAQYWLGTESAFDLDHNGSIDTGDLAMMAGDWLALGAYHEVFMGNQTAATFDPGTMNYNTTYFWRVDVIKSGTTYTGYTWDFSIVEINATNPSPVDEGLANSDIASLGWDNEPFADSYDVYFGTNETAVTDATTASAEFRGNQTAITYDPPALTKGIDYYWRVDIVAGGAVVGTGDVWEFYVRYGYLELLDEVSDVDVTGCIIYGINCGRPGTLDDGYIVINNVKYVPDWRTTMNMWDANDVNGDGVCNWHDGLYNATCPGKPTSSTPIYGMTVECSDADTNGMDHGPYEMPLIQKVTSKIFEGEGTQYTTPLPPSSDVAQCIRYLLGNYGQQNLGSRGERNMVYRFNTIEGHDYKLQVMWYYGEPLYQNAVELYIRPNNATDFITYSTSEKPEVSFDIEAKIAELGGTVHFNPAWANGALLYTYEFTGGSDGKLDIEICGNPADLGTNIGGVNAIILEDISAVATNPSPMNMEYYTSWRQSDLSWDAAAGADSHSVYFGTDYDTIRAATTASDEYMGNQTATTYDPGDLVVDTTYFWRVDEVDDAVTTTGEAWSFIPGTDTATWKVVETTADEWIQWEDMLFPDADYRFTANLSTTSTGKSVRLEVGGSSLGSVELPNTDGYMRKFHMGCKDANATRYDLRFVFEDGGVEMDYLFLVRSTSTTTSVLPTDTRFVAPSSDVSYMGVTGRGSTYPENGWPATNPDFESNDLYTNHDPWDRTFWDYRVDEGLYARMNGFMMHSNGVYDPNGACDSGPFIGSRPGIPQCMAALNKVEGAREFFKIGTFEAAGGQHRNFWEPETVGSLFNAETDTDDYHYWSESIYNYAWRMIPRDLWWEHDGYTPLWMVWAAPHPGEWWDPNPMHGFYKQWIDYVRGGFTAEFGTNFWFDSCDVETVDSTCGPDEVQSNLRNDVYDNFEYSLCRVGSWYGHNASISAPSYRPVCLPGCEGEKPWADGYWYDLGLDAAEDYNCVWADLECFDDPGEGVELFRANTSTYPASVLNNYPSHRLAIIREHSDPELGSLRCEAEFADTYSDSTAGRNVDMFKTIIRQTDLDVSELMARDICIAVNPFPYDCEIDVPVDQVLSWVEAYDCDSHDVYFGTTLDAVMHATTASDEFIGNQTAATYDPSISAGSVYYWRIDEVYGSEKYPSRTWRLTTVPVAPIVTNSAATDVFDDLATLNGEVTATGGEKPNVTIYWGDDDAGTTAGNWDSSISAGSRDGAFSRDISGLSNSTQYFFRCYGSNSAGGDWADSTLNFTTPAYDSPIVTNSTGASLVTGTSARLNGVVIATGGQDPSVIIYWGDEDGGTTPGGWDSSESVGSQGGTFYDDISGLVAGVYYYRCYGSNDGGYDWADSTETFNTSLTILDSFGDVDLSGNIVYAINCGSETNYTVSGVTFRGDVYQWKETAGDTNGDSTVNWWDTRFNPANPGKPASPAPISGVTVECSDDDTNGMDHGPYEGGHNFDVSSLFSGEGSEAAKMANVLSTSGVQNMGDPGERNMVFRFDTIEGHDYKLQMMFFCNSTTGTSMDVFIRPNETTGFIESGMSEPPIVAGIDIPNDVSDKTSEGLLLTYLFTGESDGALDIEIVRNIAGNNLGDINAITLEDLDP